ncbi:MAG: phosphatidylglycerophosphatase A [Vicinamibacteria bacterium]|nr:phosphatidylglycerophosphatase A [Vicinamibacteria bacterium]
MMVMATGLGSGYSPIAPGTMGSVVGLLLFLPLMKRSIIVQISSIAALLFLAIVSATVVSRRVGRKDPRIVVIDEWVGIWVTLVGQTMTPWLLVLAFFAFRVMDVIKPFPARRLEDLPEGWGIVLDDFVAGLYAYCIVLAASRWLGAT